MDFALLNGWSLEDVLVLLVVVVIIIIIVNWALGMVRR